MTTPTEAPREALPEPLKVVAWITTWNKDRVRGSGLLLSREEPQPKYDCNQYDPLVRLTDAQCALESERQAHAAEVERLRGDLKHLRYAGVALANVAFNFAQYPGKVLTQRDCEIMDQCRKDWDAAIDAAIAKGAK